MPASITAIVKNIERLQDPKLIELWNQETKIKDGDRARTPGQVWVAFIQTADAAKLAHLIPGSVGRSYRLTYAEAAGEAPSDSKSPPAKTVTARKPVAHAPATKEAAK